MKNFSKYLLVMLSIAFIVSSCGVEKRLHTPGFHVQLNNKHKINKSSETTAKNDRKTKSNASETIFAESSEEEVKEAKLPVIAAVTEVETTYEANHSDFASNDESIAFAAKPSAKRNVAQSNFTTKNYSNSQPVEVKTVELAKKESSSTRSGGGSAGGATLVLLVILCLFPLINLIPVYITDGGITLNFWVTLILNLTVVGAIIFSILVVLGIVSLA